MLSSYYVETFARDHRADLMASAVHSRPARAARHPRRRPARRPVSAR